LARSSQDTGSLFISQWFFILPAAGADFLRKFLKLRRFGSRMPVAGNCLYSLENI